MLDMPPKPNPALRGGMGFIITLLSLPLPYLAYYCGTLHNLLNGVPIFFFSQQKGCKWHHLIILLPNFVKEGLSKSDLLLHFCGSKGG